MFSASLKLVVALLALSLPATGRELRVCTDPNNMPFSNQQAEGFENKIAAIIANELDAELTFVWWAQRRGQITEALNGGLCDLIPGIASVPGVLLTYPPYYRSIYAFVTKAGAPVPASLDDPLLSQLSVGIELVGESTAGSPPAMALARRSIVEGVHGYSIFGDYRAPSPSAAAVAAVASGEVDVAVLWGPRAGYFASQAREPLTVTPLGEQYDGDLPMAFDIAMALRLDQGALRMEIEQALARRKPDIDAILARYAVPRLDQ